MKKNEGKTNQIVALNKLMGGISNSFAVTITKDELYSDFQFIFNTEEKNYKIVYENDLFFMKIENKSKKNLFFESRLGYIISTLNENFKRTKGIKSELKHYVEEHIFLDLPLRPIFKARIFFEDIEACM